MTKMSNQYAAMPSVHLAWSLWCAWALIHWASHRWLRVVAACYPVIVLFVIIGTANHWTLDAVGGLVAVVAAASLWRLATSSLLHPAAGAQGTFAPGPVPEGCPTLEGEAAEQRREAFRVDHDSERA